MKPAPQYLPPRSAVIFAHTRRMLDQTALCGRKFAMRVAEQYMALIAPDVRQVPFRWGVMGEDLIKAERHNAQQIARYMDATVKALPADLEDAWVTALPEPYRSDCERELAGRRGCYSEKLLDSSGVGGAMGLGDLAREFGQLFEAVSPALADGRIGAADLQHARRILAESDDLIGAVLRLRRDIAALLPRAGHE